MRLTKIVYHRILILILARGRQDVPSTTCLIRGVSMQSDPERAEGIKPRAEDAQVTLTIDASLVDGDCLNICATLTPGRVLLGQGVIEQLFKSAGINPQVGTYVFRNSWIGGQRVIEIPESMTDADRCTLQYNIDRKLQDYLKQLITAHEEWPSDENSSRVAKRAIIDTLFAGLETPSHKIAPPTDPRTMQVSGVHCTTCAFSQDRFGRRAMDAVVWPGDDRFQALACNYCGNIRYQVLYRNGTQTMLVGFLDHSNIFAKYFNRMLAHRLGEEFIKIAPEVVTSLQDAIDKMDIDVRRYVTAGF
ncbi:hypothetical protein EPN81_05030 [Patescibacteria group bacterium]|nr:MAG: hypothetical protein EPN81_05030 [Patescibacteria group bacterium]